MDDNGVALASYPDACTIVTADDIAGALGSPPEPPEAQPGFVGDTDIPTPLGCTWRGADSSVGYTVVVNVLSVSADEEGSIRLFKASGRVNAPDPRPLEGIGDEAIDPGRPTPTVLVRVGVVRFEVQVLPTGVPAEQAPPAAAALATVAATRIASGD